MIPPDASWTGYDPGFLGTPVALPRTSAPAVRLDYPHFTVVLDAARRLAAVTAVNIDGATLHDLERRGTWALDDRIPAAAQAGPAVYADNDLDRGHLVRRRDPGWGTADEARAATAATFFYPNAAPQASGFNQSKQLWVGLEDHVLRYADASDLRVSVFTAPIFADDDPPYRGIRIPRRFFKIAAWAPDATADPKELAAAGFVLDQSTLIRTVDETLRVAPLGDFASFQVPIADIATLTALDLGPLVGADVLPTTTARAREWLPLRAPTDVVLG